MKVTIEEKTPVFTSDDPPEFVRFDVRATVESESFSASSSFALELPKNVTDKQIEAAIAKLYADAKPLPSA